MAHFNTHCDDCERLLGDRHEQVNHWMDELFKKFGANHRRFRHHNQGVREAQKLFGDEGAKAAIVHIVRDAGRVPRERDYYDDEVIENNDITLWVGPEFFAGDPVENGRDKLKRLVEEEYPKFGLEAGVSRCVK